MFVFCFVFVIVFNVMYFSLVGVLLSFVLADSFFFFFVGGMFCFRSSVVFFARAFEFVCFTVVLVSVVVSSMHCFACFLCLVCLFSAFSKTNWSLFFLTKRECPSNVARGGSPGKNTSNSCCCTCDRPNQQNQRQRGFLNLKILSHKREPWSTGF